MVDFFVFILASIGLGHIFVDGTILVWFKSKLDKLEKKQWFLLSWLAKWLNKMLNCYQCSGFWSGAWVAIFMLLAGHYKHLHWLNFIVYGFAGSFLCNFMAAVMQYINLQAIRGVNDEK